MNRRRESLSSNGIIITVGGSLSYLVFAFVFLRSALLDPLKSEVGPMAGFFATLVVVLIYWILIAILYSLDDSFQKRRHGASFNQSTQYRDDLCISDTPVRRDSIVG